ncbi:MAG: hypothetical protein ABSE82_16580, partial [Nitrososphaerales archaeon]
MNSPHTVVPTFLQEPSLTVSSGVGGTVSVQSSAINGGMTEIISSGSSQTFTVPSGSTVTLTGTPLSSYSFGNWTGTQFYAANPITIVVNGNAQETASFVVPMASVTFTQVGLGQTSTGAVLTVDGSTYGISSLPITFDWVVGSLHSFGWSQNVSAGSGTRFIWNGSSGFTTAESGRLTVPLGGGTVTSRWNVQYLLTFEITGADNTALGTVLLVGSSALPYAEIPYNVWVSGSSSLVFAFTQIIPSSVQGVQFNLISSGLASPVVASTPTTIVASYDREALAGNSSSSKATSSFGSVGPSTTSSQTAPASTSNSSNSVAGSNQATVTVTTTSSVNSTVNIVDLALVILLVTVVLLSTVVGMYLRRR